MCPHEYATKAFSAPGWEGGLSQELLAMEMSKTAGLPPASAAPELFCVLSQSNLLSSALMWNQRFQGLESHSGP